MIIEQSFEELWQSWSELKVISKTYRATRILSTLCDTKHSTDARHGEQSDIPDLTFKTGTSRKSRIQNQIS